MRFDIISPIERRSSEQFLKGANSMAQHRVYCDPNLPEVLIAAIKGHVDKRGHMNVYDFLGASAVVTNPRGVSKYVPFPWQRVICVASMRWWNKWFLVWLYTKLGATEVISTNDPITDICEAIA